MVKSTNGRSASSSSGNRAHNGKSGARRSNREVPSVRKGKVKNLANSDDAQESKEMTTATNSEVIKLKDGEKAPIYILDKNYAEGYVHYVHLSDGNIERVVCCGTKENNGVDTKHCPLCRISEQIFAEAKNANGNKRGRLIEQGKEIRSTYESYFVAAKGSLNIKSIDKATNKKTFAVEFDNAQVGLLKLTRTQFNNLLTLDAKYPYVTSTKDLLNRVLMLDKQPATKDSYPTLDIIPAKKPSEKPEVEIPETISVEKFDFDIDKSKKIAKLYQNNEPLEEEDEEGVDYEEEEDEEESHSRHKSKSSTRNHGNRNSSTDEEETEEENEDGEFETDESDGDESDGSDDSDNEEEVVIDEEEESGEFDDSFLDDVNDEFESDDFDTEESTEEEEPVTPRSRSKKSTGRSSKKEVEEKPKRVRPSTSFPKNTKKETTVAKRGRPAGSSKATQKSTRGRPAGKTGKSVGRGRN